MTRRGNPGRTIGRGCTGKRRYHSRDAADTTADQLVTHGAAADSINVYKCRHGDHYHVGHRPGSRRKT